MKRRLAHGREPQAVLAAQEPLCPDSAGSAAFCREAVERRDLRRSRHGSLERAAASRDGCDEGSADVVARNDAQGDDLRLRPQADPRDAAPGTALRAHGRAVEAQQMRVGGDEDDLVRVRAMPAPDHRIALFEPDELPRILAGVARADPLDPAALGGEHRRGGGFGKVDEADGSLALGEGD